MISLRSWLTLIVLASFDLGSAHATQFAACMISSYDGCPNAMMWSCRRYKVWGRAFDSENFFSYPLEKAPNEAAAKQALSRLVRDGVCPGPGGPGNPTPIDQKYEDRAEKSTKRILRWFGFRKKDFRS